MCTVLFTNHVHTSLCHELESGRKCQLLACMEVFLLENLWSADVIPGSVKNFKYISSKICSVYSGKLLPET
jgi:hypothetical protein